MTDRLLRASVSLFISIYIIPIILLSGKITDDDCDDEALIKSVAISTAVVSALYATLISGAILLLIYLVR